MNDIMDLSDVDPFSIEPSYSEHAVVRWNKEKKS